MNKQIEIQFISDKENNWTPEFGKTADRLLKKEFGDNPEAYETLKKESYEIIKLCGDPNDKEHSNTGLILGYIQSGKTLSFTTVSSIAKDSNYQMIIIIAGTTKVLHTQTNERLHKDLETKINKDWSILKINDKKQTADYAEKLKRILNRRKRNNVPENRLKTILLTVMKNHDNLSILNNVLKEINLYGVPTLVIDDESDQASLNTLASENARNFTDDESTTYKKLRELKSLIPNHTYLQYTATPQANIFIDIEDELSPNFIYVLTPGDGYTGGSTFFSKDNKSLLKILESADIVTPDYQPASAPESLKEAMRIFFIGVSHGDIVNEKLQNENKKPNSKNRTMMINPHHEISPQNTYGKWVKMLKNLWIDKIQNEDEGIKEKFFNAYTELKKTETNLESFEDIFSRLDYIIEDTEISILNTDANNSDDKVDWDVYSNIVIGGNKLSRGYTVEGLTVTYMPRYLSESSNSDTFQQRARFFGYRQPYLSLCRIYLDEDNKNNFIEYSKSEESWRKTLKDHIASKKSLNDFKRTFTFSPSMNWTRDNVLKDKILKKKYNASWHRTNSPFLIDADSRLFNYELFNSLISENKSSFIENEGHSDRSDFQIHNFMEIKASYLLEKFLKHFKFSDLDIGFNHLVDILENRFSNLDMINLYIMSKGHNRIRSLKNNSITLFQGRSQNSNVYPGDSEIREINKPSLQIHCLSIQDEDKSKKIFDNVIALAIWIPDGFIGKVVSQN